MSRENTKKTLGHVRVTLLLLFTIVIALSGWAVVEYLHNVYLQAYVTAFVKSNSSVLRVAGVGLLAGLAGSVASIPILRSGRPKRTQQAHPGPTSTAQSTFGLRKQIHLLMMTPRPARDSSFIIRKTKNRGRIARNRDGERLPPSDVA